MWTDKRSAESGHESDSGSESDTSATPTKVTMMGPMDPLEMNQEHMLALLRSFSTPIDPTSITSTRIESLPPSRIHSTSNMNSHSNLHSTNNSTNNIHNCSNLSINYPQLANSFHPGSRLSCNTTGSMTPRPFRKYTGPASDAGTDLFNICRICQLPEEDDDILFSPCRCCGSLKYVHYACLLKWIEISTRKTKRTPFCELCHFTYVRHKRFKFHDWRMPRVSRRDKCLHTIFLLTLVVMATCAVATILCFLSDNGRISQTKTQLSVEEVVTLTCGVLFFVSFFLAMTVEIKARHTVYKLFTKFIMRNTEWQIEPYALAKDPECPKPYLYM